MQGDSPFERLDPAALRARRSAKWNHFEPDVLAMWIAEMDFSVAEPVRRAITAAVEREEFGYPVSDEATGLPAALAAHCERRFGFAPDPARVHLIPDVLRGVELAIDCFSPPASGIVLPIPSYMPFFELERVLSRPLLQVPMRDDGTRWCLDFERIGAALAGGAGTVLLCNPYNPLGRAFSTEELAELVDHHGARVVSDEIHAPLTYGEPHVMYASVSDAARHHSITVMSASKAWNLPGLRCAQVLITDEADEREWRKISRLRTSGAATIGIEANTAAYEEGEAWLRDCLAHLDANRHLLADAVANRLPGAGFKAPEATYLAWLDLSAYELGPDPAAFLLRHARVACNAGASFGATSAGCIRLNFATTTAILTEALDRITTAIDRR